MPSLPSARFVPWTMSSILSRRVAVSIAVLYTKITVKVFEINKDPLLAVRNPTLQFDSQRLPNIKLLHIANLSSFAVHAVIVVSLGMQRSQLCKRSDRVATAVLHECSGNHFQGSGESSVGELFFAVVLLCILIQEAANGEFAGAASGDDFAFKEHISCNLEKTIKANKNTQKQTCMAS